MKAYTKSAKRRLKMGRPRKQGVERTPSGQPSRALDKNGEYKIMMEVATWKRRQLDPSLSVKDAMSKEAGSVIHAWKAASDKEKAKKNGAPVENLFTAEHLHAAERVHEIYLDFKKAVASKDPRSATDFSGPGGYNSTDPFEAEAAHRDEMAIKRWKEARHAILESGPMGMMAVEAIVFENKPLDSMIGDLRLALNALVRLWMARG